MVASTKPLAPGLVPPGNAAGSGNEWGDWGEWGGGGGEKKEDHKPFSGAFGLPPDWRPPPSLKPNPNPSLRPSVFPRGVASGATWGARPEPIVQETSPVVVAAPRQVLPVVPGIDPRRLRLAQSAGAYRLRMVQEAVVQHYVAALAAKHLEEVQRLQEQQQQLTQLALIMEAAEAQAELGQQTLVEDQEEHHWHRRLGKQNMVCGHWQRGDCQRGEACVFSHPEKERGTLQMRATTEVFSHNFKTAMCKYFANGSCHHGERCMFAHRHQDLRTPGQPLTEDEKAIIQRVVEKRVGGPRSGERGERGERAAQKDAQLALHASVQAQLVEVSNQLAALTGNCGAGLAGAAPEQMQQQLQMQMMQQQQQQMMLQLPPPEQQAELEDQKPQDVPKPQHEQSHYPEEEQPQQPVNAQEDPAAAYSMVLSGLKQLGVDPSTMDTSQLLALFGTKRTREEDEEDREGKYSRGE